MHRSCSRGVGPTQLQASAKDRALTFDDSYCGISLRARSRSNVALKAREHGKLIDLRNPDR